MGLSVLGGRVRALTARVAHGVVPGVRRARATHVLLGVLYVQRLKKHVVRLKITWSV